MIAKETYTLALFLHQSHIVIIMDLVFFLHAFVIKRYVLSLAKSLWLFLCKRINVWNKFQVFYLISFNVCTRGFKCSDIIDVPIDVQSLVGYSSVCLFLCFLCSADNKSLPIILFVYTQKYTIPMYVYPAKKLSVDVYCRCADF